MYIYNIYKYLRHVQIIVKCLHVDLSVKYLQSLYITQHIMLTSTCIQIFHIICLISKIKTVCQIHLLQMCMKHKIRVYVSTFSM